MKTFKFLPIMNGIVLLLFFYLILPISYGHNHMCKSIANKRFHKLHLQSMFYHKPSQELVIVESDHLYFISMPSGSSPERIVMPEKSSGKWYESTDHFWSVDELKNQQIQLINQFSVAETLVNMYITKDNVMYYSKNTDTRELVKYEHEPVIPAVVITDISCNGYLLHQYSDDGQIGVKDIWMAMKLSKNERYKPLPKLLESVLSKIGLKKIVDSFSNSKKHKWCVDQKRVDRFLYQLVKPSKEHFTINTDTDNDNIVLYSDKQHQNGSLKSSPLGFFIHSTVYLFDVLDGKVHAFKYKDLIDLHETDKPVNIPKRTYNLEEFIDCSSVSVSDDENSNPHNANDHLEPEQNKATRNSEILFGFAGFLLLLVIIFLVALTVIYKRRFKRFDRSTTTLRQFVRGLYLKVAAKNNNYSSSTTMGRNSRTRSSTKMPSSSSRLNRKSSKSRSKKGGKSSSKNKGKSNVSISITSPN